MTDLSGLSNEELTGLYARSRAKPVTAMSDDELKAAYERSQGTEKLKAAFGSGQTNNDEAVRRGGVIRDLAGVPKATATDAAVQGATMGWSDEALAAGTAPIDMLKNGETFSEAYANNLARERERLGRYKAENPGMAIAADIAGSFAMRPDLSAAKLATALPGVISRIKEGAKVAVPIGAISGSGHADGDLADRLEGAGKGAGLGLAVSAAVPLAGAVFRGTTKPATEMVQAAINPESRATTALGRDLVRDGITPAAARAELAAAEAAGQPMTIGDLGGRNTMGLARAVATGKGEGSARYNAFLDARRLDTPERVLDNVRTSLATPEAFYPTLERIVAERRAVAAPLYEAAYAKPMPDTETVRAILSTPAGQQAVRNAQRLSANEGIEFAADVRGLDLIKRSFDDMIDVARRAGNNNESRIMTGMKDRLVREVDRAVPEYRAARDAFSSRAELEEAVEAGRALLKPGTDAEAAIATIRSMSPAEKEVARIGMARAMADMFDDPSRSLSAINKLLGSQRMTAVTKELWPSADTFNQFRSQLTREAAMGRRAREIQGNSTTANKAADIEDAGFAGAAQDVFQGRPVSAGLKVVGQVADRMRRGINEKTANRLGDIFSETDPARQKAILDAIEQALPPGGVDRLLSALGSRTAIEAQNSR